GEHRLGPVRYPELRERVAQVELDRLLRDPERLGNVLVAEPLRHVLDDLKLAARERLAVTPAGLHADDDELPGDDDGAERRLELVRLDRVHDVSRRAVVECGANHRAFGGWAEHDDAEARRASLDQLDRSRRLRHHTIADQEKLGLELLDQRPELVGVACVTDELEERRVSDRLPDPERQQRLRDRDEETPLTVPHVNRLTLEPRPQFVGRHPRGMTTLPGEVLPHHCDTWLEVTTRVHGPAGGASTKRQATWSSSPSSSLKPRQPLSAGETSIPSPCVASPLYFLFAGRASVVEKT